MDDPVLAALRRAQRELLDFSLRNRLLSLPEPGRSAGVVPIVGERAESVFARLVGEGKPMGLAAAENDAEEPATASRPGAKATFARSRRRAIAAPGAPTVPDPEDQILSAGLPPTLLARTLTRLERDSRSFLDEQGVNILFLALGQLAWRDEGNGAKVRHAPLVLVPCRLARQTARDAFHLSWDGGEIVGNLTLAAFLADQFKLTLPEAPDFGAEGWASISAWFDRVAEVAAERGFTVVRDAIALGLFSYTKFLMFKDLEREEIARHPLVRALLGAAPPPLAETFPDDADIDALIPVERLDFALDSDGSQTLAAEAVRRGGSLVIQGPPGTGKSQLITNVIAQAILDGKTVLFVAEKLAALEVVQRRLASVGLSAACLALHSEGVGRRALVAELDATLKAPRAKPPDRDAVIRPLGALRGRLNRHAAAMHAPIGETGWTAFRAIGEVARLKQAGVAPPSFKLDVAGWTAERLRHAMRLARELAEAARSATPASSVWRGVSASSLPPTELDRLAGRILAAIEAIGALCRLVGARATRRDAEVGLADLRAAARFAAIKARAPGVCETAWTAPGLAEARAELAKGTGLLRSLAPSYRSARATVAALFTGSPPLDPLPILDAILEGQSLLAERPAAAVTSPDPARETALAAALDGLRTTLDPLLADLSVDTRAAFGDEDPPLGRILDRLALWAGSVDCLPAWLAWSRLADEARDVGLTAVADRLADGSLAPDEALVAVRYALAESLLAAAMRANPALAAFDGPAFSRLVEEFRAADVARIGLARAEAAAAHAARLRIAEGPDFIREMTVLRGEIAKKRGHLPVRTLLSRAGRLVQQIKPVFMMSPLSVAAYLDPAAIAFDLLVIDEASQIEPVDAIGAIARARQIVVVGDDRQMPPTRFFARMTSDEEERNTGDEEPVATADVESILSLCTARGFPNQMLRWHYRSRHESLIAVSNRAFYENRLIVIPSPKPRSAELGLSIVRVEGCFDSGGSGTNAIEARAVAEAVMAHARDCPGETLGVAAFSVRQRDAILDALEALRRESPEVEPFFSAHPHEPFFVKNLENVQGDERDVMFISVGYARGPDGKVAMRFGPLAVEGGERRLNVLITRAKKRCVVFSGLTADDIDLSRSSARGVAVLKEFLAFAAGGTVQAAAAQRDTGDTALTDAIATALAKSGLEVERRVGLAGLFVDVAVRDRSGDGFGLGIVTDGEFYAAARSARDRDRLQETALGMMGWRLARSWAADWIVRPDAETRRLASLAGTSTVDMERAASASSVHLVTPLSRSYEPAVITVPKETPPEAVPFARLARILADIVRAEGPIHTEAVIARALDLWGLPQAPVTTRAVLEQALRLAAELEGLVSQGSFWQATGSTVVVRNRSALPPEWRRPTWLPPEEIRAALCTALQAAEGGVVAEALDTAALRLLGVGEDARAAVSAQRALLAAEGRIVTRGGLVFATAPAPS